MYTCLIHFPPKADCMPSRAMSNIWQSSDFQLFPLFQPLKLTSHSPLCQAYTGPQLASRSPPNWPCFSTSYTCSKTSDKHSHPLSPGFACSNLDPYPALSGSSSRAQIVSSMAMHEDLRTCEIDSVGGSKTPSPTHCQLSSSIDNVVIDIPTASTNNVTIPQGLDLSTAFSFCLLIFFLFYIFHSGLIFYLLWLLLSKSSLSWPKCGSMFFTVANILNFTTFLVFFVYFSTLLQIPRFVFQVFFVPFSHCPFDLSRHYFFCLIGLCPPSIHCSFSLSIHSLLPSFI